MNLSQLAESLSFHFQNPQKSERWAMYRLIMPVVDVAEAASQRAVHFEFNQTSLHGTSQSVDIALLNDDTEEVFLEAKRIDRVISSDQISKYLTDGVRGLVTNGIDWILCMGGQSRNIRIYDPERRNVNQNGLEEVIGFIRNPPTGIGGWTQETIPIEPIVVPIRPIKATKAIRRSNPKSIAEDCRSFAEGVAKLPKASAIESALLDAIVEQFSSIGGIPVWLRCELRASRISFFNSNLADRSDRIGRIELGKKQPDVLLLTTIVEQLRPRNGEMSRLEAIAQSTPHDKGPHFRRFRLGHEERARMFGKNYVDALLTSSHLTSSKPLVPRAAAAEWCGLTSDGGS